MTISSENRRAGPFVGNGVTTSFPFTFKVFATTDIVATLTVIADGDESTLVLSTDYTVSLNADQNANPGGTVEYNPLGTPMASTHKLTITSAVQQLQTLDLTNGGGFFPQSITNALDRAIILIQQLALTVGRGLQVSVSDDVPAVLPNAVARALKFLSFDVNGDPTVSAGVSDTPVSLVMQPVVSAATLATARTEMGVIADAAGAVTAKHLAASAHGYAMVNGTLSVSVAANAVTFAIKTDSGGDPSASDPVLIAFPNATGGADVLTLTAATSLTAPNGATLGQNTNNAPQRLWIVGFNDGGTFRLGVVMASSPNATLRGFVLRLREDAVFSSTIMNTSSDSAQVFYTGVAVTSKSFRILGYADWDAGLATAGVWAAGPTRVCTFGPGVALPGDVVQRQITQTGAVATGTTTTPMDDTIPQITEGNQFMLSPGVAASLSLCNFWRVRAQAMLTAPSGANGYLIGAIHLIGQNDALAAAASWQNTNGSESIITVENIVPVSTLSAASFSFRGGCSNAGTIAFNGSAAGVRRLGGVNYGYLEIEELQS